MEKINVLTFTTLYPNAIDPRHGVFVEHRIRQLSTSGRINARVVAPVPWFPFRHPRFGQYSEFARVPAREERAGLEVLHPRYPYIPKMSMSAAPLLLAGAVRNKLQRLVSQGNGVDLIDAHYYYPDGVAAVMLGHWLRKPVVITARGTDLNLIPKYRLPRRWIRWAADKADASITVCQALKEKLVELGAAEKSITVLRNGVDLELFRPVDREKWRYKLGLTGTVLLSVGHLIERKGHDIVIQALGQIPGAQLLVAGTGPQASYLQELARTCGVADRVTFLGALSQDNLRCYYGAADALVLASSREGWANVLLEAMACGTPVIASDVWGTPEVVTGAAAGVLMRERTPAGLVEAYQRLFAGVPDRTATRRYAERFSWDETTNGQVELFSKVLNNRGSQA